MSRRRSFFLYSMSPLVYPLFVPLSFVLPPPFVLTPLVLMSLVLSQPFILPPLVFPPLALQLLVSSLFVTTPLAQRSYFHRCLRYCRSFFCRASSYILSTHRSHTSSLPQRLSSLCSSFPHHSSSNHQTSFLRSSSSIARPIVAPPS